MKKHLQRILCLLCVLALALGTVPVLAEETESRIITVKWMDRDDYDKIRPDHVDAFLAGEKVTLTAQNGWTGAVSVPAGTDDNWTYDAVEGYTAGLSDPVDGVCTLTYNHSAAQEISCTAQVKWIEPESVGKAVRPASVWLKLKADGEDFGVPMEVKASATSATWKALPKRQTGSDTDIVYTVEPVSIPEGYTASVSGTEVVFTLQMAGLTLKADISGYPEGTDLSALTLTVDGADPSMPKTLTWAQVSGGYDFGEVLPGAYLVRGSNAGDLAEGYIMDPEKSRVADAVYVKAGETGSLTFRYAYKLPEAIDAEDDYEPEAAKGSLKFLILGPDDRMPLEVTYASFTGGRYELPDLAPGVYTVVETNAETLIKYYTLTGASVTGMVLEVGPGGESVARLFNQYVPAPTPEPDAEFVDIPVTKTWNDSDDRDGNRPESITVRLYADGVEVDSHVLTAAEGWTYTFAEKPRYREDNKTEIAYTVDEDETAMYSKEIKGYNIVNSYRPEVTSRSVAKVWVDNDDAQKLRPTSIAVTLSDGEKTVATVLLTAENGWSATVDNLPTTVNGKPAVYTWTEQEVLSYKLTGAVEAGGVTTFTNEIRTRTEEPEKGKKPKTPGDTVTIDDYDTPLGVYVVINHVGDCFD